MKQIQLSVNGRAYTFPVQVSPHTAVQASAAGVVHAAPAMQIGRDAAAIASDATERMSDVGVSQAGQWRTIVEATLSRYLRVFPSETSRLQRLVADLAASEGSSAALSSRSVFPGHITGSGIVVQAEQALLIRHPVIGRWLQPGGHLEGDELPDSAAAREAEEETGWRVATVVDAQGLPMLLDIDIHAIPENPKKGEPAHWHYDFLYVFAPLESVITPELPVKWVDIDHIDEPRLLAALSKLPTLHASLTHGGDDVPPSNSAVR